MAKDKTIYTEDSIQSLSPREHIRARSGMYIGSNHDPTQLVIEIFSNALDEHNLGHGDTIFVSIDTKTGSCSVKDEGQGFPIDQMREDGKSVLQAAFDEINTSAKYTDDGVYGGTSLGLNGVGGKATNFLSSFFYVESKRVEDKKSEALYFKDGILQQREVSEWKGVRSGTTVIFTPDPQFFEEPLPNIKALRHLFNDICCMCPNLTIEYKVDRQLETIHHPDGITDLVTAIVGNNVELPSTRLIVQENEKKYKLDCGLTYTSQSSSNIVAYVNYGLTEQGPHITSLKSSITKVMNKWARERGLLKEKESNLGGDSLQEGLVLVFNLISPGIAYDSQTKGKIVSKDYVPWLNEMFSNALEVWLDNNPQDGQAIIEKALLARRASEAAKKAREAVKNKAEKKKDKVFKLPTKLTDCWSKDRSECELLVCEGRSAASGLVAGRSAKTQAIYGVRGKMLSVLKSTPEKILKNQEINNLIQALGLDYDPKTAKLVYDKSKLRYGRIIACADGDYDGHAIENLLFNILWYLCPELVINGHVYSAVPPLFRVTTTKNEYVYLKGQEELEEYKNTHKNVKSILRAKGLSELDAEELSYTLLDPSTRHIVQLTVSDIDKTEDLFQRLYGKAVEPRVKYMLEHSEEARTE